MTNEEALIHISYNTLTSLLVTPSWTFILGSNQYKS